MSMPTERIGKLLALQRRAVDVDPVATYQEIGVRSFGRGLFVKPMVTGADLGGKRVFKIKDRDLVVSNVFAWEGAVAVAGPDHDEMIGSHRFMTWLPRDADVDVGYLCHYFGSDAGLESLGRASPGSAGRNRTLSIENFEAIDVPLPKINEQRRIATHLDALTAATGEMRLASERRRQSLGKVLVPGWHGQRLKVGRLVTATSRPRSVDLNNTYRMLGVRWYGGGLFERERKLGGELSAKAVYDVAPGDLVYNRLFAWKESFAIAEPAIVGTVSNEFPTFLIDEQQVLPIVLLSLLLGPDFTRQVNDASTGSTPTSRNRLKELDFLELEVTVPPMPIQKSLAVMLARVRAAQPLQRRADLLAASLLPAARNEIFSAMQ